MPRRALALRETRKGTSGMLEPVTQDCFLWNEVFAEEASVRPTSSHPTRDEPGLECSHLRASAHTGTPTSRHVCEGAKGLSLRPPHPSHTVPDRTPDGDASEQGSLAWGKGP